MSLKQHYVSSQVLDIRFSCLFSINQCFRKFELYQKPWFEVYLIFCKFNCKWPWVWKRYNQFLKFHAKFPTFPSHVYRSFFEVPCFLRRDRMVDGFTVQSVPMAITTKVVISNPFRLGVLDTSRALQCD